MAPEKPWSVESALRLGAWVFVCLCLGTGLGAGVLAALPKAGIVLGGAGKNLALFIIGSLSLQIPALVLVAFFLRQWNTTWTEAFGLNLGSPGRCAARAAGVCALAFPGAMILGKLAGAALLLVGIKPEVQPAVKMLAEGPPGMHVVVYAIGAVLLAPLAEEVLFRGIFYPTLRQFLTPLHAGALASVLFACTHFNLAAFLPLAFLAGLLTWIYERTGNLLTPILAHALFNAINFYFLVWPPEWAKPLLTPS